MRTEVQTQHFLRHFRRILKIHFFILSTAEVNNISDTPKTLIWQPVTTIILGFDNDALLCSPCSLSTILYQNTIAKRAAMNALYARCTVHGFSSNEHRETLYHGTHSGPVCNTENGVEDIRGQGDRRGVAGVGALPSAVLAELALNMGGKRDAEVVSVKGVEGYLKWWRHGFPCVRQGS
jgi:hypothetical protein